MKEIELKARVSSFDETKKRIEDELGSVGKAVLKDDRYFKFPLDLVQRVRIRRFPDRAEMTAKRTGCDGGAESNDEFEISFKLEDVDNAVSILKLLGLEDFFRKHKEGFEWTDDGVHIELFKVNDIGCFLEMEALLPFGSEESAINEAREKLYSYLKRFSLKEDDIEKRSYREMILNKDVIPSGCIEAYTDGGCSGNPGKGGWAFVLLSDGELICKGSGGEKLTTNNRMELEAVIALLEETIKRNITRIEIHTDSQYVKNGITAWMKNWKRNGWRTSGGDGVKNKELWVKLDVLTRKLDIKWTWVKGHSGVKWNEVCDSLCQEEMGRIV